MYALGIHTGHNATAALLEDGRLVACASEERFTGIKNHLGYPAHAVEWVLRFQGITPADVARIALIGTMGAPIYAAPEARQRWLMRTLVALYQPITWIRRGYQHLSYDWPPLQELGLWSYRASARLVGQYVARKEREATAARLSVSHDRVQVYEHHACHAAAAAMMSPYGDADQLVLTLDGEGDGLCGTVNICREGRVTRIAATPLGHSLGWIYLEVTRYLGMRPGEDEHKVMGLAPYANPARVDQLYRRIAGVIRLDPKNPLRYRARFDTHQMPRFLETHAAGWRFDEIAGAFQRLLEERIAQWVQEAVGATGIHTVAVGGGVFMNVKANQRIVELPEVHRFFAMPSCGDESNAIGAACLAYHDECHVHRQAPQRPPLRALYLGPEWGEADVARALGTLDRRGLRIERVPEIEEAVANLLSRGEVVARVAGRMEWGARALGNRSILAHPGNPRVVHVINEWIKKRDFWMPFAPSILKERAEDYLENPKQLAAPFMTMTFQATALGRKELAAALHPYDGTVRPQIVDPAENAAYHRLIRAFERRTGIGAVLNTSFNLHRYPMVSGPREALAAFTASGLQHLALGPLLISKTNGAHA